MNNAINTARAAAQRNAQIAHRAHDFAEKFLAAYGQPKVDVYAVANDAAWHAGLKGVEAELFASRAIGHFLNVVAGHAGL